MEIIKTQATATGGRRASRSDNEQEVERRPDGFAGARFAGRGPSKISVGRTRARAQAWVARFESHPCPQKGQARLLLP